MKHCPTPTATLVARGGPARTIGEIQARKPPPKVRRTFQPVRRNSYNFGEREARWYRPVDKGAIAGVLRFAERLELLSRAKGRRKGALGHIALEVLKLFYRTVDFRTGRLDPSIDWMMAKLKRSRAAVVRALAALRDQGFIEWIRRSEPTGIDGPGPQVRQISNAYRLLQPQSSRNGIDTASPPPVPDDHSHRVETEAREYERMMAELPIAESLALTVDDPDLRAALQRLGETILTKSREFTERTESHPDILLGQ